MLDRFGRTICVGWHPHEDLWVRAAMTLSPAEKRAAYADISAMTGRTYDGIVKRATSLRKYDLAVKSREMLAKVPAIDARIAADCQRHKAEHEAMLARKKAAMMAGRAYVGKSPAPPRV